MTAAVAAAAAAAAVVVKMVIKRVVRKLQQTKNFTGPVFCTGSCL
jgi:hypothetical protein